ncbi:diguanylate cyclase domain-containing protein [Halarcobacter sp.]|uniref:diguanylate cyclase domain-containing protein n=1 Tax=Halarcobacter sp. TaxID=2321133 RepID=UPI0029F52455|nr:diguanylate cyclase [Halarcobacter sp.]
MSNKLKEVTYLTKKDLKKLDIVLPGKYTNTFENIAKVLEVDLEDKQIVIKDLSSDIDHLNNIVDQTSKNLNQIQKSTEDAQQAIKDKNEKTLEEISKELKKMKEEIAFLQKQLFSDPLTGALNRKWLNETYLKDDCFQNDGFIAFLDLNDFKKINDTYGHLVGDQVLKYLVKFLKKELTFPGVDIVRYAGDEFLLLFNRSKVTIPNINRVVNELQIKLAKQNLKSSKIDSLHFSFAYGLTTFKHGDTFDEILEIVDELMYKNKQEAK